MNNDKTSAARFREGIELFNTARYFDAHEALEDAWRETAGESRLFLQGMTQVAVAMHHFSTGNRVGAQSVMARALRNLENYPAVYCGVDLAKLRTALQDWITAILQGTEPGLVPRIWLVPPLQG